MSVQIVGADYLKAAGIPLLQGRFVRPDDSAKSAKIAVLNEKAARDLFGTQSPIGKRMSIVDAAHGFDIEIVGVAKNAKYTGLREDTPWAVYVPYTQRVQYLQTLLVRTQADRTSLAGEIRKAIAQVARNIPIEDVTTVSASVDNSLRTEHLIAQLSSFFGVLALLLATFGLYGILSYSVARRTSEIGVRMALGAQARRVLLMIVSETLLLIAVGLLAGIPLTLLCSRYVESMLYQVGPRDMTTLLIAGAVLGVTGVGAGLIPALRAARVDPMVALRYE